MLRLLVRRGAGGHGILLRGAGMLGRGHSSMLRALMWWRSRILIRGAPTMLCGGTGILLLGPQMGTRILIRGAKILRRGARILRWTPNIIGIWGPIWSRLVMLGRVPIVI